MSVTLILRHPLVVKPDNGVLHDVICHMLTVYIYRFFQPLRNRNVFLELYVIDPMVGF